MVTVLVHVKDIAVMVNNKRRSIVRLRFPWSNKIPLAGEIRKIHAVDVRKSG